MQKKNRIWHITLHRFINLFMISKVTNQSSLVIQPKFQIIYINFLTFTFFFLHQSTKTFTKNMLGDKTIFWGAKKENVNSTKVMLLLVNRKLCTWLDLRVTKKGIIKSLNVLKLFATITTVVFSFTNFLFLFQNSFDFEIRKRPSLSGFKKHLFCEPEFHAFKWPFQ